MRNRVRLLLFVAVACCSPAIVAQPRGIDIGAISNIRFEGLWNSHVMDHLSWLSDVYGPRLTGSPSLTQASDWAMKTFSTWGLVGVHREYWRFGDGWALKHFDAAMVQPQVMPIIGIPAAYTPGTDGPVTADVVNPPLATEADLAASKGKLRGKIVLVQPPRQVDQLTLPLTVRLSDQDLAEAQKTPVPTRPLVRAAETSRGVSRDRLTVFLKQEGALAAIDRGPDQTTISAFPSEGLSVRTQFVDGGTVIGTVEKPSTDNRNKIPWITIAVEQYNRMARILSLGIPVRLALNVAVEWYSETAQGNGFNTIAEIPGSDLKDQVIIAGAHLDSVHAATGATDNAAGSAAVMEAARIIKQLGLQPRRTIRFALWGGEEEGLLGSVAYVKQHYGDWVEGRFRAETAKVSAYFNIDNGSGRVRGVWLQGNLAAEPVLREWIAPLSDLGVDTLAHRNTLVVVTDNTVVSSTDWVPFYSVGIPAFGLMQDRLDYMSRTHHTNMDFLDHASKDDLVQAAVALTVLVYEASMVQEPIPRPAVPPFTTLRNPHPDRQEH